VTTLLLALTLLSGSVPSEKPTVWLFMRTDCPISNRYAPTVKQLFEEYSSRGIEFLLIYPEPGVTADPIEKHRAAFGLRIPAVADPERRYAGMAGATTTPEAAVFVKAKLVYRGRIDDRYVSLSKARPRPTQTDLEDVLRAIASGNVPSLRVEKAIGCAIEKLP
jgi:hypothetical protein